MGSIIECARSLSATLRGLYDTYPTITGKSEISACYIMENRSFPQFFNMFFFSILITEAVTDIVLPFDHITLREYISVVLHHCLLDLILISVRYYVLRLGRTLESEVGKHDAELQMQVRRRFLVCGAVPTLFLMLTPLAITSNTIEVGGIYWLICTLPQIHSCAWAIGSIWYKVGLTALFHVVYCNLSFLNGYFTVYLLYRVVIPVGLSAIIYIALDKYVKLNFILKRALKQQMNMYQKFFKHFQDPVLIIDHKRLLYHNRAAETQLGILEENYLSKLQHMKSASGGGRLDETILARLAGKGDPQSSSEELYYLEDGADSSSSVEAKEQERIVVGLPDSTPKKKPVMRVSITETPDVVASKSGARNKTLYLSLQDITQQQAKESKLAEEKYKSMLLFSLSHELKTPLNIFQGFLVESRKFAKTEEMKDLARGAKGAWRYLRNKINDILDYAQILSGEFALHNAQFSLGHFLIYLRKTAFFLLMKKRLNIELDFRALEVIPDLYYGDRDRLEQILFNFISNAVKFTASGTISLYISTSTKVDGGGLTFEVMDTGSGMSKETVNSLFALTRHGKQHPGSPLNRSVRTHNVSKFSGLGLTVSRMICAKMGAEIQVRSQLGRGSSFSFTVPSQAQPTQDDLSARLRVKGKEDVWMQVLKHCNESVVSICDSIPDEGVTNDANLRVRTFVTQAAVTPLPPCSGNYCKIALIVDDNDFNRTVAEMMLKKYGFSAVHAENGKVAVETLRKVQKAHKDSAILVFMDIDMPVMDGIEATIAIRRENGKPRPKIIALTAFSAETERNKCSDAGMDFFIDKPMTKERLFDVLSNIGGIIEEHTI